MVKYLFSHSGVSSFLSLSERIQQNPIDKYFGRQRQRGRTNENSTVIQFLKNEQALRAFNSIDLDVTLGCNTRGSNKRTIADGEEHTPLPKRKESDSLILTHISDESQKQTNSITTS